MQNPHMSLKKVGKDWQCILCGLKGSINAIRKVECTFVHEPCKWCGQTPECAEDCVMMEMALSRPDVHVIGRDE